MFGVIIMLVFGSICSLIANSKGRSAVGWFFIGFFFHLFALILVLVLSDLTKEERRYGNLERENKRLREQVRKDRMIADRRHAQVARRLGAHDRVLKVETAERDEDVPLLEYENDDDNRPTVR